jgi:hypothetical protein
MRFNLTCYSLLLHKSCIEWVFVDRGSSVGRMLAYGTVDSVQSPKYIIFFYRSVYNGCADNNISFSFKPLHVSVSFVYLLTFENGRSAVCFSACYD